MDKKKNYMEEELDADLYEDFDIKPVMTDDEKVAEHKLVGSLMAAEQKMGFKG